MRLNFNPRIIAFSSANFAVGTGAFIISGILPMVAGSLNCSVFEIGQTATAFSIAFAIGGPLLAGPTSRIDRRTLLVGGLLLFTLAAVIGALAPNYTVLMLSRVLGGLGGSLVTPHAATAVSLLVSADRRGRAIALVLLGYAASTVFGVPLGTIVGDAFGWRAAFGVVGVLGFAAAAGLWFALPAKLQAPPIDRRGWGEVFVHREILLALAITLFQVLGQATVLTYLAVLLRAGIDASGAQISALLMVFGGAGITGTFVASRFIDRLGPALVTNLSIVSMGAAMLAWPFGGQSIIGLSGIIALWGLGSFAVNSAQQYRLIAAAPALATASLPLNSSSSFLGQSLGALLGGSVVTIFSVTLLPLVGAAALVVALCLSFLLGKRTAAAAVQPASS
jgi:predicted MFS family arabinose efflux permease